MGFFAAIPANREKRVQPKAFFCFVAFVDVLSSHHYLC